MNPPVFLHRAKAFLALGLATLFFSSIVARAGTLVEIKTPVGTMTIDLYDDEKPVTVANFLTYIQSGRYENLFAHRLDPGFVLQSGGYTVGPVDDSVVSVPADPQIPNEFTSDPRFSNTFGTIAMAKRPNLPNSATSQWFINLGDNSGLDSNNGGFTVFGRVVGGLDVLAKFNTDFEDPGSGNQGIYDEAASLGTSFGELPLLADGLSLENYIYTAVTVISTPTPPTPPTLTIKGKKRIVTKRSRVVLKGSATASRGLAHVEYKVQNFAVKKATGSSNWKIRTKLRPGRNLIQIRAVDTTGDGSTILSRKVVRKR